MIDSLPSISVIIPTLNEADNLARTLPIIRRAQGVEVIVVDGGSQDGTVDMAASFSASVLLSPPGRSQQMNLGAGGATGDILLFLHADTCLPDRFDERIRETLMGSNVVAGAFDLKINGSGIGLRLVEWGVWWRSRFCQMPYGDQGIFLKTSTFRAMGGFSPLPIMEDFDLIQTLQRRGKIAIVPAPVTTSGRRWQKLGVFRTTLINQMMILGYFLGISPTQLAIWYRQQGGGMKEEGCKDEG